MDWGLNTLLSAGAARLHAGRVDHRPRRRARSTGRPGSSPRQHRLRRHGERLHAKLGHCQRLAAGESAHPLTAKAAVLAGRGRRVAGRRSHLNDALAWSAARWAADQAIAAEATVIYVEDLRSMEARGMGRTLNTRLSQTVRGQITDRLRHLAAEHGIAVVTVPARGTSKNCPRCLAPLRHCKAPDQPTAPGWKWARCPGCGWQGDRDHGAWQRIAARGLTHQAQAPPSTAAPAPWPSAPSTTGSKPGPSSPPTLPGGTGPRPAPRPEKPHAARPGDARHPPRHGPRAAAASVRRDTRQRPGPCCPAQHAGTSA